MCTDTINATSVESLNVLGWRNTQNKPVEKGGVMPAYGKTKNSAMKAPKFQNFSEKDGKVCIDNTMAQISWAWSLVFQTLHRLSHCGALGTISALQLVNHTPIDTHSQMHSLSSTVLQPQPRWALDALPDTICWPHWAVLQAPTPVWDPHEVPLGCLPLKETHRHQGMGAYNTAPSSTGSFQHQCNGDNCCQGFPLQPCLKITLGCGRKTSRLTLPHFKQENPEDC